MSDNLKKLQEEAKRRGIKNFRVKTEVELRELLERRGTKSQPMRPIPAPRTRRPTQPIPAPRNILNTPNPEINVPILVPEIAKVMPNIVKRVVDKTVDTFSGWMNWLAESGQNLIKPV